MKSSVEVLSTCRHQSHVNITIHKVCYAIIEYVLHQVFVPFRVVEQVHVLRRSKHMFAHVVFVTKHDVAKASGEQRGQCVYDGCCQHDIQWGSSQVRRAN